MLKKVILLLFISTLVIVFHQQLAWILHGVTWLYNTIYGYFSSFANTKAWVVTSVKIMTLIVAPFAIGYFWNFVYWCLSNRQSKHLEMVIGCSWIVIAICITR